MGKIQLQNFEIVFNTNKRCYELGESVVGKCVIALEGELQLSMIRMQLIGVSEVEWSEVKKYGSHRRSRTYKETIKYLTMDYDFVRNTLNGMITKGIHEFPFSYPLPKEGIPSTFTGYHGSVKYWIEAVIEKPLFSFNHKTRADFDVEAPLVCDNLMASMSASAHKEIGFLWKKSGSVSVDITVDRRGYSPGELIAVKCQIVNKTVVRVSPRATLRQTQTYTVRDKHKVKQTKYVRVDGTPVEPGLTNVETLQVPVPANVQLSLDCSIICVSYELHLTAEIPSSLNLHLDLPLIITNEKMLNKCNDYSNVKNDSNVNMFYVQV